MDVVKTGIGDFDHLFACGGYPKGNTVLVIGGPGSGKSIFGMQYLYKGVKDYDEPGVYATLDEPPAKLRKNMSSFGWDLRELESQGKLLLVDAVSARAGIDTGEAHKMQVGLDMDSTIGQILGAVRQAKAKRLVIDSLALMNLYSQTEFALRTNMLKMSNILSIQDVTALVITEAKGLDIGIREFPPEAFMFDGVITLRLDGDTQERRISIRKMRGTKHVLGSFKFDITDTGIKVSP